MLHNWLLGKDKKESSSGPSSGYLEIVIRPTGFSSSFIAEEGIAALGLEMESTTIVNLLCLGVNPIDNLIFCSATNEFLIDCQSHLKWTKPFSSAPAKNEKNRFPLFLHILLSKSFYTIYVRFTFV